ncbi:MAG: sulfotransferase domain-containing protein, partial [Alphaproteobacteria bacterium]
MHRPQVLHIGFSKCASTYLRALFRSHPGICLVFKSGFFTPFLSGDMTFAEYQSLFGNRSELVTVESDEHLTLPGIHPELGVRTTNIAEFAGVADRIRTFLPDVRIILIIRNQASLIASRYSEFLIRGGSLAFDEFASRLMGDPGQPNVHYQNYYARILELLQERLPRPNLLVLLQEDMRRNTTEATGLIARFMGLDGGLALKHGLRTERRSLSVAGASLLRRFNRHIVRRPSLGDARPDTRVPYFIFRNAVRLVRAIDYFCLSRN